MNWTNDEVLRWERKRSKGKINFVLFHGIIKWGLPMFLIVNIYFQIQKNGLVLPSLKEILTIKNLASLILWILAGSIHGIWVWSSLEKSYKMEIKKQKSSNK